MMRSIFRLFFFLIILNSCSTIPKKLEVAERVMENAPDFALKILKQLQPTDFYTDSHRALYGLLLFEALDKNDKSLEPDSLINFSIQYYQNKGDKAHLAKSYFYKARQYKNAQCYDEATILYLQALDCLQEKKDFTLMGKIYSDMGDIHSIQLNYKESLKKYFYSLDYFNRAGKKTDAGYVNIYIGRTYRLAKNYKIAHTYYIKAIAQTTDSIFRGIAFQEIGINYYMAKQFDSAQYYLRKSLRYPFKGTNYAIRCYILSDLLFDLGQYDSSRIYALDALKHRANFYSQRECYRILVNIEYLQKDITQMGKYMTKYQSLSDSVRKIESQTKTTILETMHKSSIEVSKSKTANTIVIVLAILLIVFILWYYYRQNKHTKTNISMNESMMYEQTEKIRNEGLFVRINVLFKKIDVLKAEQAEIRKKSTVSEKEKMDRELYNQVYDFDNEKLFFKEMDLILNKFVTKLNNCNSGITTKEMQWCCLHLLQIPNQDVLLLLNYKSESLNKLKQRLARKLTLTNVTELYDFLLKTMLEK